MNRVQHIFNALLTIFELLAQGGKGRILPILQVDDRISNAVNFVISQHPFDGCNHGSTFNPALFDSLAFTAQLAFCAAALVFVCLAGYTELDRQGKARAALTQVKAAQLAARAVSAQCYSAGTPFADQSTHDGFAEGIAGQIETLGALPGTVTLLQISEDGYTVEQLLYAEGDMRALYDAETGYTVWRAEQRIRFDRSEGA